MASSLITGGTSFTVATLVPVVQWGLDGFPHPVPESVPYLIAAGLLTLGHAAFNWFNKETKVSNEPPKPVNPVPSASTPAVDAMAPVASAVAPAAAPVENPAVEPRRNI